MRNALDMEPPNARLVQETTILKIKSVYPTCAYVKMVFQWTMLIVLQMERINADIVQETTILTMSNVHPTFVHVKMVSK